MSKLFGGSKSTQNSYNRSYDTLNNAFGSVLGNTQRASNAISALLGGDSSGFDAYKNATGYDWTAEQGSRGITKNKAANGLLRSGSTGTALVDYGNNLQQTYADKYLGQLSGLANMGLQAGSVLSGAGNVSNGKSSNKPGLSGLFGGLSTIAASDRRLKNNIKKLSTLDDGLNVYRFTYKNTGETRIGVMADEVASLRPWALGPKVFGYQTVDYANL